MTWVWRSLSRKSVSARNYFPIDNHEWGGVAINIRIRRLSIFCLWILFHPFIIENLIQCKISVYHKTSAIIFGRSSNFGFELFGNILISKLGIQPEDLCSSCRGEGGWIPYLLLYSRWLTWTAVHVKVNIVTETVVANQISGNFSWEKNGRCILKCCDWFRILKV